MISPKDIKINYGGSKMPAPGQHFLLAMKKMDGIKFYPAVMSNYCDPADFEMNCIYFDEKGIAFKIKDIPELKNAIAGWAELFVNTKIYKIEFQ